MVSARLRSRPRGRMSPRLGEGGGRRRDATSHSCESACRSNPVQTGEAERSRFDFSVSSLWPACNSSLA